MSAVEAAPARLPSTEPGARQPRSGALPSLCPYLAMPDGTWRSSNAAREHRCTAVSPPVQLSLEKQRRLCVDKAHLTCATYGVALASRAGLAIRPDGQSRPIARMTPMILDRGRFDLRIPRLRADRPSGQAVLVGLLAIAFVAIVLGRPADDSGVGPLGNIVSASPATGVAAATEPGAAASTPVQLDATQTPAPTNGASATTEPSTGPTQAPSVAPSPIASGQPASSGATYRVKSGDTLSGIAKHFGTNTSVLAGLNGITDPSRIRIGQILRLP